METAHQYSDDEAALSQVLVSQSLGNFFSDAHLIGQSANWMIDQIFGTELGFGSCSDWHETWKNGVFRPKFAKMGPGEPIFGRKIEQKWNKNESF